jgi:hypothetical protein
MRALSRTLMSTFHCELFEFLTPTPQNSIHAVTIRTIKQFSFLEFGVSEAVFNHQ